MPSQPAPAELLADLAAAFDTLDVRWYVFGAQAALVWGRPRLTTDVDVTVHPGTTPTAALVAALRRHGFEVRFEAGDTFVAQTRVLPLEHTRSGLAADIVLAGPGLEELFLSRAVHVDIGGISVPFISPEDLVVTKILAGRAKDLEDIRGVLAVRGNGLRVDQIEDTLSLIEDALGQSDLRPAFNGELTRWRAGRR